MSLATATDVQRYVRACVAYANGTCGDKNFIIEFHNMENEYEKYIHEGYNHIEAQNLASSNQFYTYEKGKNVYIHVPNPSLAVDEVQAKIIKGGTLHEVLHRTEGTYENLEVLEKSGLGGLKLNDPLRSLFNMIEDHRIERADCRKFAGDAKILRDLYRLVSDMHNEGIRSGKVDPSTFQDDSKKILSAQLTDLIARENWMELGDVVNDKWQLLPEDINEMAARLVDKGFDDRMSCVDTVPEAIQLAKDLFYELFEEDPDKHIEENQQSDQQQQQSQQGKGEEWDFLEFMRRAKEMPMVGDPNDGTGQHVDYTRYFQSDDAFDTFQLVPSNEIGLVDFGRDFYRDSFVGESVKRLVSGEPGRNRRIRNTIDRVFDDHSLQVNALANKIRRLLQVRSQARYTTGATEGKIHRKRAYRAALPTIGDGHWNREIFKRRYQDDTLDVCVEILCDFSGSMSGEKMAHAAFGGYILSDAIGRVLKVPTQVATFSETGVSSVICVLKNWNESVSEEMYKDRVCRASNTMGGNDDASAIAWAYDDILKRKEKRKIIIVLSDGSPASGRMGDCMRATMDMVKEIEQSRQVEIYGIGIQSRNVNHIYSESETISHPKEIEDAILNTVKRKLLP